MPFRYSCFISYRRSGQTIVDRFVRDLREALSVELAPLLDLEVFDDTRSISGGEPWEEAIAEALCRSVVMIVVFTPTYLSESHTHGARELQAMLRLEAQRLQAVGHAGQKGMIIPVVLRGPDLLPNELRERQGYNFDRFMTGDTKIYRSPGFHRSMREMASFIYEWHEVLRAAPDDLCADCNQFRLPSAEDVRPWLAALATSKPLLPFH